MSHVCQPTGVSAISAPRCISVGVADPSVELELLGQQEVAVQRVVTVDPDATVQVVRGVEHVLAALRGPELGRRHLLVAGTAGVEPPGRLPRGELDRFGVDVGVGGALADGLEGGDRTLELHALLHVRRR